MSSSDDEPLDVRAIEAFQAVMSSGSMTAAARQLGIGQPRVTRLVRELETAVGFDFFYRNGPRISPTDRGLRFYEDVQRLMNNFRQIRERAAAIREESVPALDIAATPTMAGGIIGQAVSQLGDMLPKIVNVQTMDSEHVVRALRNRTADFGLSALPFDHAEIVCHTRFEAKLVAVVESGSVFDTPGPVALDDFKSTRLVTVANAYRIRHAIDGAMDKAGVRPCSEFLTNSSLNAVMAARSCLGIAIIDPVTAFGIPVRGVTVRPLESAIPYVWGLFGARDDKTSPLQKAFIRAVQATSVQIVKQVAEIYN